MSNLDIPTARVFTPLLRASRYKGAYGGRGSGKSHFFAEAAVERCLQFRGTRLVCVREVQRSLKESVKRLIEDKIEALGVGDRFRVLNDSIITPGKGVILFQGMQDHTAESIKSLEGFDVGYVAQTGAAPEKAVKTLLALTVTGNPQARIAAARELTTVINTDPTARDKVPPALAGHAEILVQLGDLDTIPPDEIIRTADALLGQGASGDGNGSSPEGVQVAAAPLVAALPALDVSPNALLGLSAAALSTLGLSGDTMQAGEGTDGGDGEDNGNAEDETNPLNLPVQPPAPGRPEDPTPPDFPPKVEQKDDDRRDGVGKQSRFGEFQRPKEIREFEVGSLKDDKRVIFQPTNDPNILIARANQQAPQFESDLRSVTESLSGAELAGVRVKDIDQAGFGRLREKIGRNLPPEMIADYVGGRIFVETPDDLAQVEKLLGERFDIINRDDTLARPRGPAGYRAVHIQVKLPDGMSAEIQLHPGTYRSFADEARAAYVRSRSLKPRRGSALERKEAVKANSEVAKKYAQGYRDWLARRSSR